MINRGNITCKYVLDNLSAFIDCELSDAEAEEIQKHIDTCEQCRAEYEQLKSVSLLAPTAAEMPRESLKSEVLYRFRREKAKARKRRLTRYISAAVAAVFCLFIIGGTLTGLIGSINKSNNGEMSVDENPASDNRPSENPDTLKPNNSQNNSPDISASSSLPSYYELSGGDSGASFTLKILARSEAVCRVADYEANSDTEYTGSCTLLSDNTFKLYLTDGSHSYDAYFTISKDGKSLRMTSGSLPIPERLLAY